MNEIIIMMIKIKKVYEIKLNIKICIINKKL